MLFGPDWFATVHIFVSFDIAKTRLDHEFSMHKSGSRDIGTFRLFWEVQPELIDSKGTDSEDCRIN